MGEIYDDEEVTTFHLEEFKGVLESYRDTFLTKLAVDMTGLEMMQARYHSALKSGNFNLDNFREYSARGSSYGATEEEIRIYEDLRRNNSDWVAALNEFHRVLDLWRSQLQGILDFLADAKEEEAAQIKTRIDTILNGHRTAIPAGRRLYDVSRHEALTAIRAIIASGTRAY